MPELPEVETVVRTLAPHVLMREILTMDEVRPCRVPESLPCSKAVGYTVAEVFRRGKFIVARLAEKDCEDLFWVTHLRMTGSLMAYEGIMRESEAANPGKYTRCVIKLGSRAGEATTEEGCRILFNDVRTFGRIFLGNKKALEEWSSWKKLGPEPLSMGEEAFAKAIRGKRTIKSVLMDQHVIAGIGNIYADESLFAAQIHPARTADGLSVEEKGRLYAELVRLLLLSIEECGSSIRDYHDANGNVGAFQNHFMVYGRGGESCNVCGARLRKIVLNGRGTVYCPRCQKKSGRQANRA